MLHAFHIAYLFVYHLQVWASKTALYMAAIYLNPSLRSFGMCKVGERDSFVKRAEGAICELGKEAAMSMSNNIKGESQQEYEPLPKKAQKDDIFAEFRSTDGNAQVPKPTATDDKATVEEIKNELRFYKWQTMKIDENLLRWWYSKKNSLPILSAVSRSTFLVQTCSSESERHFSTFNANNIVHPQHSLLAPDAIACLCVATEYYKNL